MHSMKDRRGTDLRPAATALLFLAMVVAASGAHAQIPDTFTNLKVLPKDISKPALIETMRGFSTALGEGCDLCHSEKAGGEHGMDFASDAKHEKETARLMLKMVADINGKYLSEVKGVEPDERVTVGCITCHRGLAIPHTLAETLSLTLAEKGIEGTVKQYRELRDKYYGSGAYDFGDRALPSLARSLAKSGKAADAYAILDLNAEQYPKSPTSEFTRGEIQAEAGERDKAMESLKKALAISPGFEPAKRRLDQLTKGESGEREKGPGSGSTAAPAGGKSPASAASSAHP